MRKVVIGSKGVYRYVDTPFVSGWEKVESVEELSALSGRDLGEEYEKGLTWKSGKLSKIPANELRKVVSTIRAFPSRETLYTINYNFSDGTWRTGCPKQNGSGGSVQGETEGFADGYVPVGTIHTHPNGLGAFWSTTDEADQRKRGGIHVVFGLEGGIPVAWKCTFFTSKGSYQQELWDVFEQVDMKECNEPVEEWVDRIKASEFRMPVPAFYDTSSSSTVTSTRIKPDLDSWRRPVFTGGVARYGWAVRTGGIPGHIINMLNALVEESDGMTVFQEAARRLGFLIDFNTEEITDVLYMLMCEIPACSDECIRANAKDLLELADVLSEASPPVPGVMATKVIPTLEAEDEAAVQAVMMLLSPTGKLKQEDLSDIVDSDCVVDLNDPSQVDADMADLLYSLGIEFKSDLEADLDGRDVDELQGLAELIRKRVEECSTCTSSDAAE